MIKEVLFAFFTSLGIALLAIPSIIRVSYLKHLYDVPDDRKSHEKAIPTLGGLAIFAGFTIALLSFTPNDLVNFKELKYILVAILVIFFIGIKDDILIIAPLKKLAGQFLAVFVVVVFGGIKITSMYGFLGITELSDTFAIPLSIFTILVIMNGFNLIDGVNCLSGGIGVVVAATFGLWFYLNQFYYQSIIAFSLVGALLGFLWFNKTPAKIFMGDTGSLILGLINGVLAIYFIELNTGAPNYAFNSIPMLAFGILIVPLFDTLRVFTWRILNGKSPFHPDKNHVHHRLLDLKLSHLQTSGILILANIFFIFLSFIMRNFGSAAILSTQLVLAAFFSYLPTISLKRRNKKLHQYTFNGGTLKMKPPSKS